MFFQALLTTVLLCSATPGFQVAEPRQGESNTAQTTLRLGLRETEAHLIRCQPVHLDGQYCGTWYVPVRVRIRTDGTIESCTALSGSNEVKRWATDAVAKWQFRPVSLDGEPREAIGIVSVRVSWRNTPEDSCDRCRRRDAKDALSKPPSLVVNP